MSVEAERETQIGKELGLLEEGIRHLEERIDSLENRLCNVLRKKQEGDKEPRKDELSLVPLAEIICRYRNEIGHQIDNVCSIIERLEL